MPALSGPAGLRLKGGFKLPSGLNAGQQIELLLDSIALPYYGVQTFDDLPTPFRCVATDIRAGEPVVLGSGSFALALRATMAIPAAFTPVVLDERLLVDGGALNNVPADVVKAMGAQVAIAVNVSSSTDESPPPSTIFAVLGQTLDSMMTIGTRQALKSADLVIVPNLQGLTGGDWRRVDDLVAKGYKAAEANSAALLRYQVDEATYAEWMRARLARRRTTTPMVDRVVVEGVTPVEIERITAQLQERLGGRPLVRADVEDAVMRIAGTDRYAVITQNLRPPPTGTELLIHATPKSYGPPFLLPSLDLQNIDSNSFALALRMRVAVYDTPLPNSEVRFDVGIGTDQSIGIELYKLLGHRGLFVAPRAYFAHTGLNGYLDGQFVAEYRVKRAGVGIDVGYTHGDAVGSASRLRRSGRPDTTSRRRRPRCRKRTARTAWHRSAGCSTARTVHSCRHGACACAPRCATTSTRRRSSTRKTTVLATARDVPRAKWWPRGSSGWGRASGCSSPEEAGPRSTKVRA